MIIGLCLEDSEPFAHRQALIDAAQVGDADAEATLGDLFRIGDEFTDQDSKKRSVGIDARQSKVTRGRRIT